MLRTLGFTVQFFDGHDPGNVNDKVDDRYFYLDFFAFKGNPA
jgi:hypothetical protein